MHLDGIDHRVSTVKNIEITCDFYEKTLGTRIVTYDGNRKALSFGTQKINLHQYESEIERKETLMAEEQILNGVNVTAVTELVKNIEADPELGQCKFHIKNNWKTCGQNQSKIESFYAAKQEIPHKTPFTLKADEPNILAGHDTEPNPVEHLLNALASCLTTSLVYHAAIRGIKIEELESHLEGDLDLRGFLGLSNEVRTGFQNIRVNFKVKTEAGNIEKLKALSKLSPVFDVTSNGTNVQVNIEKK